jgi:hypothetical protein
MDQKIDPSRTCERERASKSYEVGLSSLHEVRKVAFACPPTESPPWALYKTRLIVAFARLQHTLLPENDKIKTLAGQLHVCSVFLQNGADEHMEFRPSETTTSTYAKCPLRF